MQTEIMGLYKEKGVNPASGCVPMLLTLPVLFAFYSLLSQSIELRGAQFGWWISDLSEHDPLYITPVLMGADDVLAAEGHADRRPIRRSSAMMMIMPLMLRRHVPVGAERPGALLVRRQPVRDRPAVLHELVDRPAGACDRQTASGASPEERWRGHVPLKRSNKN